jgi:hypothetical protein
VAAAFVPLEAAATNSCWRDLLCLAGCAFTAAFFTPFALDGLLAAVAARFAPTLAGSLRAARAACRLSAFAFSFRLSVVFVLAMLGRGMDYVVVCLGASARSVGGLRARLRAEGGQSQQ